MKERCQAFAGSRKYHFPETIRRGLLRLMFPYDEMEGSLAPFKNWGGILMDLKSVTSRLIHTSTLLRQLFKAPDLNEFMEKNRPAMREINFAEYIENLSKLRDESREKIIKRAGIERTYGHQLFRGIRMPSRDKVLQLAFGLELDVDKTQQLLRVAEMSLLYPRVERDAVILYCISHHKNFVESQSLLENRGLTLLGCEDKRG